MRVQARILLVDDNEVDFVFTRRMLSRLSSADPAASEYEIDWAAGVDEALEALQSGRHDVCLVDYQLGDRDGLDLLREASRRGIGVPMIVLTGRGDPDIDAKAMALGASGYLDKETIDPRQLDRALRYALSRENLIQDLLDQNEELLHLHKLTELALGGGEINSRLQSIADQVGRASNFPGVEITRYDAKQRRLFTVTSCGCAAGPEPEGRDVDLALSGAVVRARRPRVEMDLEGPLPDEVPERWPGARCFVSLPLLHNGTVVGALELASERAQAVDSAQLERLTTLANHLGILLGRLLAESPDGQVGGPAAVVRNEQRLEIAEIVQLGTADEHADGLEAHVSEPLAGELKALLRWYSREAEDHGMELHLEAVGGDPQNLRGDAVRLRRVISTYVSQALRFGDQGRVLVQTMPPSKGRHESEEVLVSFRLPTYTESVREWEPCLEAGRELVRILGGTLETVAEPGGGLRVLLGASLSPAVA